MKMVEIRTRKHWKYVNDLAGYEVKIPVVVFDFTLDELEALESWVPYSDGFHKEVSEAKIELENLLGELKG